MNIHHSQIFRYLKPLQMLNCKYKRQKTKVQVPASFEKSKAYFRKSKAYFFESKLYFSEDLPSWSQLKICLPTSKSPVKEKVKG